MKLPADLASERAARAVGGGVDAQALLKAAALPTRKDRRWQVELAPLTRMGAWKTPEIKNGDALSMLGFTFAGEKGEADAARRIPVPVGGKAYGLALGAA